MGYEQTLSGTHQAMRVALLKTSKEFSRNNSLTLLRNGVGLSTVRSSPQAPLVQLMSKNLISSRLDPRISLRIILYNNTLRDES